MTVQKALEVWKTFRENQIQKIESKFLKEEKKEQDSKFKELLKHEQEKLEANKLKKANTTIQKPHIIDRLTGKCLNGKTLKHDKSGISDIRQLHQYKQSLE